MNIVKTVLLVCIVLSLTSCATSKFSANKYNPKITASNWTDESQIEVGQPNIIVDSLGNITGIPAKILLLNPKIENHNISPETVKIIEKYIDYNSEQMKDTKIRINQFTPVGEFKRLVKNKKVQWWWRVFPGIPTTMFSLTGRLIGGDHYNPYTDTINIYSDVPSVALHESGHAVDFSEHAKEGTAGIYAVGRILTPVTLYQEHVASEEAINYLKETKDREGEKEAYKTLYPAGGTYVGGATGIPFGSAVGAAAGHIVGVTPRKNREKAFEVYDNALWSDDIISEEELMLSDETRGILEGLKKSKANSAQSN